MKRIGFTVIAVAAIVACRSDQPLTSKPNAAIQDANQNGGNPFFFWTAPVVNQQPPASQVFSRQLSPVVTITNEGPAGSSGSCVKGTVQTFSGSDVTVSNSRFHVNWHTDQDNLNADCTYRITVTAAGTPLGFADVDVVSSGKELKNVITQQYIPLLDDRTLPIEFFIGVGSQCESITSDCGEGTARGGANTTIVTTSGRAGVFIPANALGDGEEVTISVESVDANGRTESGECIPGLLQQYPGTPGVADNACYDYHAVPLQPGIEQAARFRFRNPVTVGICPDVEAFALDHATLDQIQIFQFDVGLPIRALDNVPAPFLRCDPHFTPSFGSRRSIFESLAKAFATIVSPRPLYARTSRMMFDVGAGGSTDGFSRFTWALPVPTVIDFETYPDGSPTCASCALTNEFAGRGVVFSFSSSTGACPAPTNAQLFLSSTVYDPAGGAANHSVTSAAAPGSGFCSGTTTMSFAHSPDTVRFQLRGPNAIATFPIAAFDGVGGVIPASEIDRSNVSTYTSVGGFAFRQETITIIHAGGIGRIELGMNGFIALIDDLIILP